jgi:hypothetical protein
MWANRYFGRYWGDRYWSPGGAGAPVVSAPETDPHLLIAPRRQELDPLMFIEKVPPPPRFVVDHGTGPEKGPLPSMPPKPPRRGRRR